MTLNNSVPIQVAGGSGCEALLGKTMTIKGSVGSSSVVSILP
jgi:hypothetical protein